MGSAVQILGTVEEVEVPILEVTVHELRQEWYDLGTVQKTRNSPSARLEVDD